MIWLNYEKGDLGDRVLDEATLEGFWALTVAVAFAAEDLRESLEGDRRFFLSSAFIPLMPHSIVLSMLTLCPSESSLRQIRPTTSMHASLRPTRMRSLRPIEALRPPSSLTIFRCVQDLAR